MDNQPVFGSSEEYRTWKALTGKHSKKKLDALTSKILAVPGHVHPAILIAAMDAVSKEYGTPPVSAIKSMAGKARPLDCSPAIRASEILEAMGEVGDAMDVLATNTSKDLFHLYLAEAQLYHGKGDRMNSVSFAQKALDLDPSCMELYDILISDDPDGPWVDLRSVQCAYEGVDERTPKDPRLRQLYDIYLKWFQGDKDEATNLLIHSSHYLEGDW
jgi:hypothetical protein